MSAACFVCASISLSIHIFLKITVFKKEDTYKNKQFKFKSFFFYFLSTFHIVFYYKYKN